MFDSKVSAVRSRQLRVNTLVLPFTIVSNATPASKTFTNDEPSVLCLKLEGIDYTTVANGGFDTSAEASAITFATSTDATGIFSALVKIGEPIGKLISVKAIRTGTTGPGVAVAIAEVLNGTIATGSTAGVTSVGDKLAIDFDSAVNFATTNYAGYVEVVYSLTKY